MTQHRWRSDDSQPLSKREAGERWLRLSLYVLKRRARAQSNGGKKMTEIDDDIWKLDCALRADVEALIKRAIASLPTDEAITFLYAMHEAAGLAMSELEDEQRNARQDVIYGLLDQAGNDGR